MGATYKRFGGRLVLAAALAACLASGAAQAGPFAEFESDLRGVYAIYRNALFATNQNKPEESAKTVAALSQGWSKLEAKWAKAAPPQYADDAQFAPTLSEAAKDIATASKQIADGQLGVAHLTLEKIRDQLGALRVRNNISTSSDRMNEFHEEMEKTLEHLKGDLTPAALGALRGEAAVLAYLADRIAAAPPPEAKGSTDFDKLIGATKAAVKSLREAVASGDAAGAKRALMGLKKPYAMLFLKFG